MGTPIESRFDLPAPVTAVLRKALELGVADALDIYALGARHGSDWNAMLDELVGWVHVRRHELRGSELAREIYPLADAVSAWLRQQPTTSSAEGRPAFERASDWTEPFCACGRVVSRCDGSRAGCRS